MSGIEEERITGDERRRLNGWTGLDADRFVVTVGEYAKASDRPISEIVAFLALARAGSVQKTVREMPAEFSDAEADELRRLARIHALNRTVAAIVVVVGGLVFMYSQCGSTP